MTMDLSFWISVGVIFILLVLSGFFSGAETALTAASRAKLRAKADKGNRAAARALKLTEDTERLIGALLLGNNMANILAASLATTLFTKFYAESGVLFATLFMTALVLIFSEVLPKTYAISKPEDISERVALPLIFVVRIFAPIVGLVQALVRTILWATGLRVDPTRKVLALHEEIRGALNLGHSEGIVEKEHLNRMLGVLQLGERTVEEIMVHRSKIEMVNVDWEAEKILGKIIHSHHTRLPVFHGDSENIIGVLHAKDVLKATEKNNANNKGANGYMDIRKTARLPYFVPEKTTLDEQMREFLKRRAHFALVVDEYGVLQGLITLEDILEEIVGDITDEFDIAASTASKTADGDLLIEGETPIRDLNRRHGWSLPDDEFATLAGLIIHEAQIIPVEGQVFYFHGCRFEVISRQANRLALLKVRRLAEEALSA